eukprot:15472488-Alexandrium_andersonii.AAC.1
MVSTLIPNALGVAECADEAGRRTRKRRFLGVSSRAEAPWRNYNHGRHHLCVCAQRHHLH